MKSILHKFLNKEVGINLDKPFHIQKATLVAVEADYFSVMNNDGDNLHHLSYNAIIQLIENPDGVRVGGFMQHKELYPLIIKVGHIVEYVPA